MSQNIQNDNLILISGKTGTGKSASLMNLKNPEGVLYLNCESNKKLPFKSKFREMTITDPKKVYTAFLKAEKSKNIHTIVVDTATYLMNMFESLYVVTAEDSRSAWGDYAQFFQNLMQQYVAKSTKNVIFLAHTADVYNEKELVNETFVKVKGSLMNMGIESFFSTVLSTKRLELEELENYNSELLNITEQDKRLGFKYLYQTQLTKETVFERIRSPIGMWDDKETFIDNDLQLAINRLHEYYA